VVSTEIEVCLEKPPRVDDARGGAMACTVSQRAWGLCKQIRTTMVSEPARGNSGR
jgi:hypothetical protein